jgi:hypothetical protein
MAQKSERTCSDPAPANNGLDCVGDSSENRSCNIVVLLRTSPLYKQYTDTVEHKYTKATFFLNN